MKKNAIQRRSRGRVLAVAAVIGAVATAVALAVGYDKMRSAYLAQCVITDKARQVEISVVSGKLVKPDVIAAEFGLKNGANLGLIDFKRKRTEILQKIPMLRELTVTRILPDRVRIRAEERTPVVRLGVSGRKQSSRCVADAEGVVFECVRGTRSLPVIREASARSITPGQRLKGRTRAALDLVLLCRESQYSDLAVLEVDTSKADFLSATLGNYSLAKISWDGMDDATPASRAALASRLDRLLEAIRARCDGLEVVVWNATHPDYVYGDTQEKP